MNAVVLSIGDELVSGLTVDTNSAWLAQQLAALGIRTAAHLTVGDDLPAIAAAIRQSCEQLELEASAANPGILIITGGLGPTEDDLTREAVADALNQALVEDPDAVIQIERYFKSIHRPMAASNRRQALRPHEAMILENTAGTAPGLHARKGHLHIFAVPGVPREMQIMFARAIVPVMRQHVAADPVITQTAKINTFGMGESQVGEKIKDLMARRGADRATPEGETIVGTTVSDGIVSVRIYATGTAARCVAAIDGVRKTLAERLGALIFSDDDEPLEGAVAALLREGKNTVAVAESCTGGMIATMLTNTPGSSASFLRGWVTYANAAKHEDLAIPDAVIAEHGAVSEAVARAMAESAKKFAQSDFAIGITGIAGPDGGTTEKPVGTVWIALASPTETAARKFIFPGNRQQVRLRAAQMALALLRWRLMNVSPI